MAGSWSLTKPTGLWKSVFREQTLARPCLFRSFVTITHDKPIKLDLPPNLPQQYWSQLPTRLRPDKAKREIKIYQAPPSIRKTCPEPVNAFNKSQLAALDPTGARSFLFSPSNPERANPGDILHVTFRTGEPFSGVLLALRSRAQDTSILLRNQLTRVGTEMQVKIYSPLVASIEVAQRAEKRARRRRLYYMRQVKHDRGDVSSVVLRYLRMKQSLAGGGEGILGQGQGRNGRGKLKGGNKPKKMKR